MINESIEKLQKEMNENKSNSFVQIVGAFLIQHIKENENDCKKVLNKDKTILKSCDEMRKVASKKKVGNYAVLTDEEGFEIVLKYFEMNKSETTTKEVKNDDTNFDVKFEDLFSKEV